MEPAGTQRPCFVEVLDRDGEVAQRLRIDALPATLGRGYDNALILDDPYVAARHLQLERDAQGRLLARDLGTRNGLIDAREDCKVEVLPLTDDALLRIGRTYLRVRSADAPVPPERIDRGHRWIERWSYALAACAVLVLVGLYEAWVSTDSARAAPVNYVSLPLGLLAVLGLWAGAWSLASRLFAGHAHFVLNLSVGATGVLAFVLLDIVGDLLAFMTGATAIAAAFYLLLLLGLGVLVFAHLALMRPLRVRRMALVAATLTVVLIGLDMFRSYQARGILLDAPFMAHLSFPALRLAAPVPLEDFVTRARALQVEVDRRRIDRGGADAGAAD